MRRSAHHGGRARERLRVFVAQQGLHHVAAGVLRVEQPPLLHAQSQVSHHGTQDSVATYGAQRCMYRDERTRAVRGVPLDGLQLASTTAAAGAPASSGAWASWRCVAGVCGYVVRECMYDAAMVTCTLRRPARQENEEAKGKCKETASRSARQLKRPGHEVDSQQHGDAKALVSCRGSCVTAPHLRAIRRGCEADGYGGDNGKHGWSTCMCAL